MILHIVDATYLKDYVIEVSFDDGRKGTADLIDALKGPVFEPMLDKEAFSDFRVDEELRTIVWGNGADLAPEYVYFKAFENDPDLQERFREWGYLPEEIPAEAR